MDVGLEAERAAGAPRISESRAPDFDFQSVGRAYLPDADVPRAGR